MHEPGMAYSLLPTSEPDTTILIHDEEPMDKRSKFYPKCCPFHCCVCYICGLLSKCLRPFSVRRCIPTSCRNAIEWIVIIWRSMRASSCQTRTNKKLEKEIDELQEINGNLQEQIKTLESDLEALRRYTQQSISQVRSLEYRNTELTNSFEQEKEEKEKALTRLSEVAGERLRFNNPAIADLSDENRPNKLAEKFSELYDNEWTEFYETLDGTGEEAELIGQIVSLLQDAFTTCSSLAERQRQVLTNAIEHPANLELDKTVNYPDDVLSKVIDFQKRTATLAFQDVEKIILEKSPRLKDNDSEAECHFIKRCSQLCWMMAIQDPPMYLDFGPEKGSVIDKNVFRLYTKSGENVDFLVWPAVFLHKNGPIVQKGVLQPQ